jgi:hypothetical protein
MGNLKASPVAPIAPMAGSPSNELGAEQPMEQARDFHFAVTWVTLFAHLDPIEAFGPRVQGLPPALALVPIVAAPLVEQPVAQYPDTGGENAAWEMIVPKMVRSDTGDFFPAEREKRRLL